MKITRNIFVLTLFAFSLNTVAQITKWREMHKGPRLRADGRPADEGKPRNETAWL